MRRALARAGLERGPARFETSFPQLLDRDWLAARRELTAEQIAGELGRSPKLVANRRSQHGLTRPGRQHWPVTYPQLRDVDWLRDRRQAGRTYREIADELGCSIASVNAAVWRSELAGMGSTARSDRARERAAQFREAWDSGEPIGETAARLGVTRATVMNRVRRLGLARRPVDHAARHPDQHRLVVAPDLSGLTSTSGSSTRMATSKDGPNWST